MQWSEIGSIAAIVTAVGGLIVIIRSKRILIADVAGKYQQIAMTAAEQALKLQERIVSLEERVDTVVAENRRLRDENVRLRDWAERLVRQVQKLGADPVEL